MTEITLLDQPPITEEQIAAFEREGAVLLQGVIDVGWRNLLANVVEAEQENAPDRSGYFSDDKPERSVLTADNCYPVIAEQFPRFWPAQDSALWN